MARRTARDNRDLPHPEPVERIELNEEHIGRRVALVVILLIFGLGMLGYTAYQLFNPQTEWVNIEAYSSKGASCAQEFGLLYRPGSDGMSPNTERREVTELYSELCRTAFEQFHNMEAFDGVNNIYAINRRPNETLTVDKSLYRAFEAVGRSGSRFLYLGPVYDRYSSIFFCDDDSQLLDFDPRLSPEVAREYQAIAGYANDPRSIQLELLGENRICLRISEAYLAYAQQEGIENFIDFSWTRNAFIADYLAEELTAQGYTNGALTSYDGFVRCLDGSARDYSLQLYDRQGQTIYSAAVMDYQGPMSVVTLRDYPINDLDLLRFYELRSGEIRTSYLDPADGLCKNAVHNLTFYSQSKGCGELLLEMMPLYIAESFREDPLPALAEKGIHSIRFQNGVICPTDPRLRLRTLYADETLRYTVAPAQSK